MSTTYAQPLPEETETDTVPSNENSPKPLKDILSRMREIREERRRIGERDSELHEEWRALEADLLARSEKDGLDKFSAKGCGTAVVSEQILPNVVDWDAYLEWERTQDMQHVRQRRISTAAYRELVEAGIEVPGVVPYIQKSINLRAN